MSKRDRARSAKEALDVADADAPENIDVLDADESADPGELRPTGKRSGRRSSAGASTIDSDADSGSSVAVKERKKKASAEESSNPFVRVWLFLKQVVAELRKVIWPTRREMITYTIVVLAFVIVMTAFISGIDLGFAKGVLWIFS